MKILTVVDAYNRECLAIHVTRKITAFEVIEQLAELFLVRGAPEHLRLDNGSEFMATIVRGWLERSGIRTLYIEPGSPWENGYIEPFNGKLRDELLDREIFDTVLGARTLAEGYRWVYDTVRPHSALEHRPPAPEAILRLQPASA